jgi:hypothetical protein
MVRLASAQLRFPLTLLLAYCVAAAPLFALRAAESTPPNLARRAASVPAPASQLPAAPQKADEVIVKFRPQAADAVRQQILDTYGKAHKKLRGGNSGLPFAGGGSGLTKLTVKDNLTALAAVSALNQLNQVVEWAEPNYLVARHSLQSSALPNDQQFPAQWALLNTGQEGGVPGADINVAGAAGGWTKTTGDEKTVVAVIDTGVDTTHPDLRRNLWVNKKEDKGQAGEDDDRNGYVDDVQGWNFVADNNNVADDHGHGTRMAGLIAARGNNGQGVAGVLWEASLLPLKALDATGSGSIADVVEAMDYAVEQGAGVINCSFGTPAFSQALLEAINRAAMAGVVVVASAGNDAQDISASPYYPAGYAAGNLISVAATTNGDLLAAFSNWSAAKVHVAAPGVSVLTTERGGGYASVTGTSASAALTSGVAGLLKTLRGWVSAQTVRASIVSGARKVAWLEGKAASAGVVNAGGAVIALANGGGDNGNGNGGGNGGGNGNGNGAGNQTNLPPLDFMRANRPARPEPRVSVNSLPDVLYDDPGSGGGGGVFTEAVSPRNEVGAAGDEPGETPDPTDPGGDGAGAQSVNLGSKNFNFTAPVLALPGRAGLGLALALSYNSKVWSKSGTTISFNADKGSPGPGWSLGFGAIQGLDGGSTVNHYLNSTTNKYSYIYLEPDGTRHELAQVGTTTKYESYDSSYVDFDSGTRVLRLMNGTQITFGEKNENQYLPTRVKDRNGNFLTIAYAPLSNGDQAINYVVDTLGRHIDFDYENGRLTRIRQLRNANSASPGTWPNYGPTHPDWHNYVVIEHKPVTVSTNFGGLTLDPAGLNGTQVWVPVSVTYPDGGFYRFFYTSYAQMYLVERWVPNMGPDYPRRRVAYTYYNLQSNGTAHYPVTPDNPPSDGVGVPAVGVNTFTGVQTDCPAFTERREWAENFNGGAVATYAYAFPDPTAAPSPTHSAASITR